ncbi:MAG: ATP-binding protein [Burkholderiaceae bacterium]|nr:ATP-binding protein [Burkholderiaceae bacterium]
MRSLTDILDDNCDAPVQIDRIDHWTDDYGSDAREAYRARLACWILRIYSGAAGMPPYCEAGSPKQAAVAQITGVCELADTQVGAAGVSQAIMQANELAQAIAAPDQASLPVRDCNMRRIVNWLAASAGLNALERDIFEFGVALRAFTPLRTAVATWGNLTHGDLINALSAVLELPAAAVGLACQPHSALLRCGLLRVNYHEGTLDDLLKVPRQLARHIPYHLGEPPQILAHLVVPMAAPGLKLADFSYMHSDTRLAQCWLAGAVSAAARGEHAGHLLVSGEPGLGKTEWVRALLLDAQTQAMELAVLQEDGAPLSGEERLSHLRLAMSLLRSTTRGVIIFDEADDVFRSQGETGQGDQEAVSMVNHRASLNRLIEDSQVPVIWIMNHPDVLDDAVLRRFDTVIPFAGVPRSVRLALLASRGHWDAAEIKRWTDIPNLTPALIDRLATVQSRAQKAGQTMDADLCGHWLHRRLPGKATRHLGRSQNQNQSQSSQTATPWSAEAVNASEDLLTLADGIKRCGSARVLLYGPPGTGKTAYAHALARMLDRPLMEQRASDLLSPYVGETEQRISRAFESALDDDAVLFIDEADSLLANREHAVRNWEVSQVNELLEQLGDFEGVVVLATNRLEALDGAVLRRLDAKIRFDALTPEQARRSFESLCEQLGLQLEEAQAQAVAPLASLTPGDFACIARRLAFAPLDPQADPAQALVDLLAQEVRLKTQGRQPMGFQP